MDLKWKRTPEDIQNMQVLQLQMLEAAQEILEPNGVIVYSTCTIEPEENEKVVEIFLEKHPEFSVDSLLNEVPTQYLWNKNFIRTFPHKHEMDGTFVARLRKRKEG